MEEMKQNLQMVYTQHSGLKTVDWASAPHRQSTISYQGWGWARREMEYAKKARECGGEEAV